MHFFAMRMKQVTRRQFCPDIQTWVPVSKLPWELDADSYTVLTNRVVMYSKRSHYVTRGQMEAARKVLSRFMRRLRVKFQMVVSFGVYRTSKAEGARMGRGKGPLSTRVGALRAHTVLFRFNKLPSHYNSVIPTLCRIISKKLPFGVQYMFRKVRGI